MKKKVIGGIAVAAIALTIALNVNFSAKNNYFSDISLANVEALAQGEITVGPCYCISITTNWCILNFSDGDYWWASGYERMGECN